MEPYEISDCICKHPYINLKLKQPDVFGRYIFYKGNVCNINVGNAPTGGKDEFAICDPWNHMKYIGSTVMKKINGETKLYPYKKIYDIVD